MNIIYFDFDKIIIFKYLFSNFIYIFIQYIKFDQKFKKIQINNYYNI